MQRCSLFCLMLFFFFLAGNCNSTDHSLKKQEIRFSNNTGSSFHEAIVITGASSRKQGFDAEYQYLNDRFGSRGKDWYLLRQTILYENNRIVDVVEIEVRRPLSQQIFFFEVTPFFSMK